MLTLKTTTNYEIFKESAQNRYDRKNLYKRAKYQDLKHSLKTFGQFMPVLVSDDMTIVAGQTRAHALADLGMPVNYIQHKRTTKDMLVIMLEDGTTGTSWTNLDVVNFWSDTKEQYALLLKVHKDTSIALRDIAQINNIYTKINMLSSYEFKRGQMKIFSESKLRRYISLIHPLLGLKKFTSSRTLISALKWSLEEYDFEETQEIFSRIAEKANKRINIKISQGETAYILSRFASTKEKQYDFPPRIANG